MGEAVALGADFALVGDNAANNGTGILPGAAFGYELYTTDNPDSIPVFHPAPPLTQDEVQRVRQSIHRRINRVLWIDLPKGQFRRRGGKEQRAEERACR